MEGLKTNIRLETLVFGYDCVLTDVQATQLGHILKSNKILDTLIFGSCESAKGLQTLFGSLDTNTTLTTLKCTMNAIGLDILLKQRPHPSLLKSVPNVRLLTVK